jgi:hypothetical protein
MEISIAHIPPRYLAGRDVTSRDGHDGHDGALRGVAVARRSLNFPRPSPVAHSTVPTADGRIRTQQQETSIWNAPVYYSQQRTRWGDDCQPGQPDGRAESVDSGLANGRVVVGETSSDRHGQAVGL